MYLTRNVISFPFKDCIDAIEIWRCLIKVIKLEIFNIFFLEIHREVVFLLPFIWSFFIVLFKFGRQSLHTFFLITSWTKICQLQVIVIKICDLQIDNNNKIVWLFLWLDKFIILFNNNKKKQSEYIPCMIFCFFFFFFEARVWKVSEVN